MFLITLLIASITATYLLWRICHCNGKIIYYFLWILTQKIYHRKHNSGQHKIYSFYDSISPNILCLIGILPLVCLSLSPAILNHCFNSMIIVLYCEAILGLAFLLIPNTVQKQFDLLGLKILKQNLSLVIGSSLWCLIFSIWVLGNSYESLDQILSNTNPDMWAYVRRFSAMIVDNLEFYGGSDSFRFQGNEACAFFLGSPKKFSSFLGSLIVVHFRDISLGISVFQGMLGCTLFICLFQDYLRVSFLNFKQFPLEKIILVFWILFSPPLFWLLVSAYFSNTLFLILICLVLRDARKMAIAAQLETVENFIFLFAILLITFSFYPAFLPVLLVTYLGTVVIYFPYQDFRLEKLIRIGLKLSLILLIFAIFSTALFLSQANLEEVQKSLNPLITHGSNFLPLNPWSLVQEKPKPMPNIRDFGWYFNLIIGLISSLFLIWKLWQTYQKQKDRDVLAGLIGVCIYACYLLAHIPLESSYRLMKISISLVYPLAIFGLLVVLLRLKNFFLIQKSWWLRSGVLILAIVHTVFHVYKVFDLNTFPAGDLVLSSTYHLEEIQNLAIVGCADVHKSQFYERLVGLEISRQYPNLSVQVVSLPAKFQPSGDIIYGKTILNPSTLEKVCLFEIN